MNIYLWTRLLHLFFVVMWMATVFALPVLMLAAASRSSAPREGDELLTLGKRLYGFGHQFFGVAIILGLVLWLYVGIGGAWLHAKLLVVALLLAHFIISGVWLKKALKGGALPSLNALRWHLRTPVALLLVILYLVLGKPF